MWKKEKRSYHLRRNFNMDGSYSRRRVCYARSNETGKLKFVKRDSFAPGFMVWAGFSYYGKTSLIFIDKDVKVNADHYINKDLKPFLTKDVPRKIPGREKEMVFHQDSASQSYCQKDHRHLNKWNVKFITSADWMPKGTGAASYGLWYLGYSEPCRLQKRKIYTMTGLKKALKDEWNKILIKRTLTRR